MRREGRGLRTRCIVGRLSKVVILGRYDCYISLQDDLLAERIETGNCQTIQWGVDEVAYRGVESARTFLLP